MAAVVADTSPSIALHPMEHLSVLKSLFVEVQIQPAVAREARPSLALQVKANVVIAGERTALRVALRLGLPVVGTVGNLLRATPIGVIAAVRRS